MVGGACRVLSLVAVLIVIIVICDGKMAKSRFTNIMCKSYNKTFGEFETCRLNVLGRGVIGVQLHLKLYIVPINTVSSNLSVLRRYNGFKPFMYNTTLDFCKFAKQSKKLSFEKLVLDAIATKSNLNHTCPYTHDIIVNNLVFNDNFLQSLPLPQGEYKIQMLFGSDNIWRVQVDIVILREE
ncbi:uncharacterized protein LOC133843499 isoform X2 [Drosophila sulfurigaster albostrigata]|uniref:uncharacterized protein LOC133843499 isoform X2 n=1 Tax=Drosophila sulfurigaster albostrigata TaxID=89887 RepID=UPI002D21998B|nr:uncharacterized protein LOC133843499 isoform X2 [Drosophila sulfurigaster albostrigata]